MGAGRRPINYRKLITHIYPFQCMTFSDSVSFLYSVCVCVSRVYMCVKDDRANVNADRYLMTLRK